MKLDEINLSHTTWSGGLSCEEDKNFESGCRYYSVFTYTLFINLDDSQTVGLVPITDTRMRLTQLCPHRYCVIPENCGQGARVIKIENTVSDDFTLVK